MVTKRRKKSGRKKRIAPLLFLITLLASLASIILLTLYFRLLSDSSRSIPPIYEEIFSSAIDLNKSIIKIDCTVYETLYRFGTQEKDVSFLDVQPRHQNGHVWDFAELLIRCPNAHSALNLQKIVARDLTALGSDIRLRKEKTSEGKITCHVFVKDFYTHKITLKVDSRRPSTDDVRPRIAIIIDDLGYDLDMATSFFQLDLPLSFSVLPSAPFTEAIVREANKERCELVLHLPMEPENYPSIKPGPGALFRSMGEHEIRQVLDQNLRQITGVRGVNNHMGSSFTENREKMLVVLKELKIRNLFYIDSRTTKGTVALELAKEIGVPAARRWVFLDNDLSPKAMKIQIERLLGVARHRGSAVGIGHPYKETLEMLEKYRSRMKIEFQVVHVSELVG